MSSLFLIFFTKYSTLLIEKVNAQAKKFLVRLVLQQTYESKYFKSVDASLSADVLWYTVAEGALHFQKELINRIAWSMRIEFLCGIRKQSREQSQYDSHDCHCKLKKNLLQDWIRFKRSKLYEDYRVYGGLYGNRNQLLTTQRFSVLSVHSILSVQNSIFKSSNGPGTRFSYSASFSAR